MSKYTSIQLRPETRENLARLKRKSKESYDDVITELLKLVPEGDEEGDYTDEFRIGLLRSRIDIREDRLTSHDEVKKRIKESG